VQLEDGARWSSVGEETDEGLKEDERADPPPAERAVNAKASPIASSWEEVSLVEVSPPISPMLQEEKKRPKERDQT
jgi:hypothetical protein